MRILQVKNKAIFIPAMKDFVRCPSNPDTYCTILCAAYIQTSNGVASCVLVSTDLGVVKSTTDQDN